MIELVKKWIWKIVSSIVGTIQTILIVFRFIGVIDCSWWIVFSPMFSIAFIVLLICITKIILK